MLKEIKEIKLKELNDELQQYQAIDEQIQAIESQIPELYKQIEQLRLIPYKHFNWFQKHITQRKEYKDYKSNIQCNDDSKNKLYSQIYQLRDKRSELSSKRISYIQRQLEVKDEVKSLRKS